MTSSSSMLTLTTLGVLLTACGRSSLPPSSDGCPAGAHCIPVLDGFVVGDGSVQPDGGFVRLDAGTTDSGLCPTPPDCSNPFCAADPGCHVVGHEICNNGIDDNDNGLVDCADPQCFGSPFCQSVDLGVADLSGADLLGADLLEPAPDLSTVCDPIHPDCLDPRCQDDPKCFEVDCLPDINFGSIPIGGGSVTRAFDTRNATRSFTTCAFPGGTAKVGVFRLTQTASIKVDFSQDAGGAHVVDLFRAGRFQSCEANPIFGGCIDAGQDATATRSFPNLTAGLYYVIVQSYPSTQGTSTVTISTGCPGKTENCDNGIDDNCNGLVDCADPACIAAPSCIAAECTPDINLGTLVVGDPPDMLTLDTSTMVANRYHPTCAGSSTGDDVVVRFTLHSTDEILVGWQQTGDHVFGLFQEAASGLACDALQLNCYPTLGANAGQVAFSPKAPGQYVFIFKPSAADASGILQLSISARQTHMQEICDNSIDDDGNGLVDCADPACLGVPPCNAPLCLVDQGLGSLSPGITVSTSVDTRSGRTLYPTTCATGTGKEKVLRFNVTQPIGLAIACTPNPGTHVFQLAAQLQPLAPCNAHNLNCFDPSIVFGCDVEMPDIQPGTYNLIVAAFQAGEEGIVNLDLTGNPTTMVSCTTAAECMDSRCVTSPFCQQFACKPTVKLGILPLDGSTSNAVVSTAMGTTGAANVSCAGMTGGMYQDVDFQLPAKANLVIDWAQAGNADFALFLDPNDLLGCDASTEVSCTTSNAQATGVINLPGLAVGRYHLIVKANAPGQEGGVVLQLKGTPAP